MLSFVALNGAHPLLSVALRPLVGACEARLLWLSVHFKKC